MEQSTAPNSEFYNTKQYGQRHGKIVFLLAGWKTRQWMFWIPAQILALNGYRCIVYTYGNDVFSPDAGRTVTCLSAVRDDVLAKIAQLKTQGLQDFAIFGFSLGTMIAFMVANNSPDVSKVIVNLTSTHPADSVWTWDKINVGFKRSLVEQHITLAEFHQAWDPIAPSNNINHFKGKQTLIYLAKHDQLMPFSQAVEIVHQVKQAGSSVTLVTNQHGNHTVAGFYNLANAKIYLDFLKGQTK